MLDPNGVLGQRIKSVLWNKPDNHVLIRLANGKLLSVWWSRPTKTLEVINQTDIMFDEFEEILKDTKAEARDAKGYAKDTRESVGAVRRGIEGLFWYMTIFYLVFGLLVGGLLCHAHRVEKRLGALQTEIERTSGAGSQDPKGCCGVPQGP